MYTAVIFDFDGTICDTGEGIKKSARYALQSMGLECPPAEELGFFIGPPLFTTFKERFGASDEKARELVQKYRERYNEKGVYECELYAGIYDLLASLRNSGLKIGIASSKPTKYIELLLEKFEILSFFDAVCGVDIKADCETKTSIIARTVEALGVTAKETVVAGDRSYDIIGASENEIDSIGVLWGYGSYTELEENGAKYILEKPCDIEAVALGLYERTTAVHTVLDGRILYMHVDDVLMCNDVSATRECVDHPGGVAVIGITDDDEILLVRQFRYPYKETIYEIPAGKVEKGEDPYLTGQREFKEECGAVAEHYFPLGEIYPSPGYTNEVIRLWGATGIHFEEQALDEDEFLEVHKMKLDTLVEKIMSGEVKDAKTIAAVFKLKEYVKTEK